MNTKKDKRCFSRRRENAPKEAAKRALTEKRKMLT